MSISQLFGFVAFLLLIITMALLVFKAELSFMLFSLASSLLYYIAGFLRIKRDSPWPYFKRILKRELPFQVFYLLWLILHSRRTLILYFPLCMSSTGKICLLFLFKLSLDKVGNKEKINEGLRFVEELVLLQTLGETLVIFEAFYRAGMGNWWDWALFWLCVILIKLKHCTNWAFRYSMHKINVIVRKRILGNQKLQKMYQRLYSFASIFDFERIS